MLKIIQIIALIQGLFVLFILFNKRKEYKKITFWLLFGTLISVLLYIIGDDKNNLIVENTDWFLFDNTLFVTFLFLFFRYYKSGREQINKLDYLFFLPNFFYLILEVIEIKLLEDNLIVEIFEVFTELTFIIYLACILHLVLAGIRKIGVVYFVIPIVILFVLSFVNDILKIAGQAELPFFSDHNFNSYLLLIVAFLFYFIAFKLFNNDNTFLPKTEISKYKNSKLSQEIIIKYKTDLIYAMEIDKLYRNGKLSIQDISEKLTIPRQYISEVLNEHMNTNFQDFVNEYRVEEFIKRLQDDRYNHFTLLGIATDVGFNSKSSFNAIFKKFKGLMPTEYRKNFVKSPNESR
jgi:AraC-like DNA-binding protein